MPENEDLRNLLLNAFKDGLKEGFTIGAQFGVQETLKIIYPTSPTTVKHKNL